MGCAAGPPAQARPIRFPLISGVILNMPEALWLASCFSTTERFRRGVGVPR